MNGNVGDYLSVHLGKVPLPSYKTYVGGSKALDSLVKLIASTESFFHPSNSGAWTADVCIVCLLFIKSFLVSFLLCGVRTR